MPEDKPFNDREDVKTDIRLCALVGNIFSFSSLGFAALGVVGDALNLTLGLESMSWFLPAILFGVTAILPNMRSLTAKHLFGIEAS